MKKVCNCGYETDKESFKFCPLCGNTLNVLESKPDGTLNSERKACRVIHKGFNPEDIYYYKISPIDKEIVWIYETPLAMRFIIGCHISKIKPYELERIERCVFRKNNECGHASSCKMCSVYKGNIDEYTMKFVNVAKE